MYKAVSFITGPSLAGTRRAWVLTAGNQFPPAAPPIFGSPEANAQYAADKNLQRTNATKHLAWFWQPGFFQPWLAFNFL